jgi:hypothetical protein
MDTEHAIAILKIVSAATGGALGVAGLLLGFKTETGRLKRAGYVVLIGIIFAALISIATSIFESQKERSSSIEQAARTERLLHELNRSIQPITQLKMSYWIQIPPGIKVVDDYIKRLSSGIEDRVESLRQIDPHRGRPTGLDAIAIDSDGQPMDITVEPVSDLWPRGDEAVIGRVASFLALSVDIFKQPIDPEHFRPIHGRSDFGATGLPEREVLSWNRKTSRLYVWGTVDYKKALWSKNEKISSFVDLYGAQMFLIPPRWHMTSGGVDLDSEALIGSLLIRTVVLTFAEGRDIWLSGKNFKKAAYQSGYPAFSITLPKDETKFREFTTSRDKD